MDALQILLIDDNAFDRAVIGQHVAASFPGVTLHEVVDAPGLARALSTGEFDVVLLDYLLPWASGLEILRDIKTRRPGVPVLMVTGSGNEEIAIEAMKAGLDDYILKSPAHLARLPAAIRSALQRTEERHALAEAEARYQSLFHRIPVGIYQALPSGELLDANAALVAMLGYPDRAALLGTNLADHFADPDGWAAERALLERDGSLRDREVPLRRREGTTLWARSQAHAVRAGAARILCFEGSLEEITEWRRAKEALLFRTGQLEAVRRLTAEIAGELDLAALLHLLSRRTAELVHGSAAAVLLWDEEARALVPRAWHGYGAWMAEVRIPLGAGLSGVVAERRQGLIVNDYQSWLWAHRAMREHAEVSATIAEPLVYRDALLGVITVTTTDPARQFSEEDRRGLALLASAAVVAIENARLFGAISRAKAEWENTFDAAVDLIAVLDGQCRIVRANQALARRLGAHPRDAIGRRCADLFPGPIPGVCSAQDCLHSRAPIVEEHTTPAGETFVRTCSPFHDGLDDPVRVVLIAKDVTAQRRLQQQLVHSEKMAAMGRLISGVAHELNNPLTSISGTAQLLALTTDDARLRESAGVIASEADRAAKTIRTLLSFARPHRPERRLVSLNALVEDAIALRAYELSVENIRIVRALDPSLPMVPTDPQQIRQAILNLLVNAEQAIAECRPRGEIRLSTAPEPARASVVVRVEDDGPGIPPALLDRIFEPFFSTRDVNRGTGLGLSVVDSIVREHGGTLTAGNRTDGGAWFQIELPASEPAGAVVPALARPAHVSGGRRVLVVDDEAAIVQVVAGFLTLEGHHVDVAVHGQEAAAQLRRERYDVVFMDMKMPEFDGERIYYEVLQHLAPRPRVIVVTGDAISERTRAFLARTGLRCVEKPFALETILDCLRD